MAPRPGIFTVTDAAAESPLSPLHLALLLNAYLGWAPSKFIIFLEGISLLIDSTGTCRFCNAKQSSIHSDKTTPQGACSCSFHCKSTCDVTTVVGFSDHIGDNLVLIT